MPFNGNLDATVPRQSLPGFPRTGSTTLFDTVAYLDANLDSIRKPMNDGFAALASAIADIRTKVNEIHAVIVG